MVTEAVSIGTLAVISDGAVGNAQVRCEVHICGVRNAY
mgnify:CR=1 FL=1